MIKKLFLIVSPVVFATIFAACDLSESEVSNDELDTTAQEIVALRTDCGDLPYTKTIQRYMSPAVVTISGSDDYYDSNFFGKKLTAITNGSRSIYYRSGCYSGTLKSVDFQMVQSPTNNNGWITCKVKIVYAGTIYNPAANDPCYNKPATKKIERYLNPAIVTISGTDNYNDSNFFGKKLTAITNGSKYYYYNSTCYRGTLRSVDFQMVQSPTNNNGWISCKVKIIYSGTVNKK
jgi:hypothetical protein